VILRFPYQDEPFTGPPPPSLPAGAGAVWRPLIPITLIGPTGKFRAYTRAILDPGADDTVFTIDTARRLAISLLPHTGHGLRWRGQLHALRFGKVELQIAADDGSVWQWPAVIAFSPAPLRYPILGQAGCLQFFDARFLGADLAVELEANPTFPGTQS
jgi:hypothetical protein